MAKKRNPKSRAQGGQDSAKMLAGLALIASLFVALPTVMVLAFGLVPTLVAFLIDPYKRKYCTRCVGALNVAGVVPYLLRLWSEGTNSIEDVVLILGDPLSWMVMYAAAGLGWLLYLGLPSVISVYLTIKSEQRSRTLKSRQAELVDIWGEEVTGVVKRVADPTEPVEE